MTTSYACYLMATTVVAISLAVTSCMMIIKIYFEIQSKKIAFFLIIPSSLCSLSRNWVLID